MVSGSYGVMLVSWRGGEWLIWCNAGIVAGGEWFIWCNAGIVTGW